ncbi:MAG: hypothetical protein ACXAB4_06675 [Candidatus Hodarchaeales archaeon]|jgi:hypothetical protein
MGYMITIPQIVEEFLQGYSICELMEKYDLPLDAPIILREWIPRKLSARFTLERNLFLLKLYEDGMPLNQLRIISGLNMVTLRTILRKMRKITPQSSLNERK